MLEAKIVQVDWKDQPKHFVFVKLLYIFNKNSFVLAPAAAGSALRCILVVVGFLPLVLSYMAAHFYYIGEISKEIHLSTGKVFF